MAEVRRINGSLSEQLVIYSDGRVSGRQKLGIKRLSSISQSGRYVQVELYISGAIHGVWNRYPTFATYLHTLHSYIRISD